MLDYALLAAVAAVVRTGSFDRAAQDLHVTPSAVSQRVKLLEERLGTVLVVRGQPCTPTPAGRRLCRHAEEVSLLEHALRTDLGQALPDTGPPTFRIAINADSLATWFIDAMARVEDGLFDLVLDDQDHSADWLRRGEVCAAVTAGGRPVQGCDLRPLGALRYIATASPAFVDRWFADGVDEAALRRAPALTFNAKDTLQTVWVAGLVGRRVALPTHWLPATQAFVDATLAGLGWGLNPEPSVAEQLREGRLVALVPDRPLDVPLFWQWSRLTAEALRPVTEAVLAAAARYLVAPSALALPPGEIPGS